ncbi:FAD-dependent oxidoreductase [Sorangium sp. So ce1128]|uniref:FAD-dependent oxidoreductase n=1 Tax=Sorangium cellulosum TaxID=56 RepID=A0A3S5GYE7_SORCE|nr:FAD-dependent oxidoreductase [Sorangium cellulosum]
MDHRFDVIIAGAGPVGLFLACELGLAGVSVLVLERDATAASPWKAPGLGLRGLNTAAVEAFYRRGLLDGLFEPGERPSTFEKTSSFQYAGTFAGILLDANKLTPAEWAYKLPGPSLLPGGTDLARVESVLAARAAELGVTIERGTAVTGLVQDDDGVTVTAGTASFRAAWLVGCDGGRSTVRKSAGFDFVGTDATFTGYVFLGELDNPAKLSPGFHRTPHGLFIVGDVGQVYVTDFDGAAFDRSQPITREHLEGVLRRVSGIDVKIEKLHVASSFTDRSKQATTYRHGRVLLAGDSAHIHSPLGAQGLNTGIGDAINLGWKLAAVVHGSAPTGLLDTYTEERHPIAAAVLEWSRAQVVTLQPNLHGAAIGKMVQELLQTNDGTSAAVARIWGLSQRYDLGDAHPLVGMSAPDFELADGTRLGARLQRGRGLLLDFADDAGLAELARGWASRVDHACTGAKNTLGLRALLIRPDGVVAWTDASSKSLDEALARWF